MTNPALSNKPLSELIKTARKTNKLTQADFGKFFEPSIAQPTIARWEKGDLLPDRKHLPKIASLINLTLEELLNIIDKQLKEDESVFSDSEEEIFIQDRRHLNVLNKGAKAWNRWREKNYRVTPQLEGAKPKEDYLDEIDLNHAFLRKTDFRGKSLRRAKLYGADLSEANLSNADLSNADLLGANLRKANLTKTNLTNANLWGADLSEARLVNAYLCGANLKQVNLSSADLTYADMRSAILNGANLEHAILRYCSVYGISAWDVNLQGAVQKKLYICPHNTYSPFVDCLENAVLKSLEIHNYNNSTILKLIRELQDAIEEKNASFKDKLNRSQDLIGDNDET